MASRTLNAAFSATGMANCAVIIVFGVGAVRDQDFAIWLYYAGHRLRPAGRRLVHGLDAEAEGLDAGHGAGRLGHGGGARRCWCANRCWYLGVCTVALFLLFALPGWIMFRDARAGSKAA